MGKRKEGRGGDLKEGLWVVNRERYISSHSHCTGQEPPLPSAASDFTHKVKSELVVVTSSKESES